MRHIKTYEEIKIRKINYQDIADAGFYIELEAGLNNVDGYIQFMYDDTIDDIYYSTHPGAGKSRKGSSYMVKSMGVKEASDEQKIFEYYFIFYIGSDMSNLVDFCKKYKINYDISEDASWSLLGTSVRTLNVLPRIRVEAKCEIDRDYVIMFSDYYKNIKKYNL